LRLFAPIKDNHLALGLAIAGSLVFSALVFWLLQLLPGRSRRWLIIGCTFLAGCFYAMEFFWPVHEVAPGVKENFLTNVKEPVGFFVEIMGGLAIGLGVVSLASFHAKAIALRKSGWGNSIVFFAGLLAMIVLGIWNVHVIRAAEHIQNPEVAKQFQHSMRFVSGGYNLVFNGLFQPLNSTMFSVLAFFIVSAAYRAFRIRSAEAALMSATAFIVMLGMVPLGMVLTSSIGANSSLAALRLENLGRWIMVVINMSTVRAINFGVAVGGLAMALRVWLSLERGAYFDQRP
jgi:hypothetical protein